jgi:phosphoglycolate phosphatase
MLNVDLIVIDKDGTLVDSLPDLTAAANHVCRRLGLPEPAPEAVKHMIGGGDLAFVRRFLGPGHEPYLEEALKLYLDFYHRHAGDRARLYPGVQETLAQLSGRKKLAVLSNKRQSLTELVLKVMGILPFFTVVRGAGELALKPSPEPLTALIAELKGDPRRTLMVGDKPADILAARGAGALSAAVTYGYGDLDSLVAAAPDFLLHHFRALQDLLA